MDRLSSKNKDGIFTVDTAIMEKAIQRLGQFEDAYEDLMNRREQLPKDLEEMRASGKEKTVRYKETVAEKLINNSIVMFFERHGFK